MSSLMAKGVGQINALGTHRAKGVTDLRSPIKKQVGHCFLLGVTERLIPATTTKKIKDTDKTEKPTEKCPGDARENPNSTLMMLTSSNQEQD